jgi:sugar phosphate isomerase/epimerase
LDTTERLCLHTVTTKPWEIETAIENYAQAGVKGISVWRDAVEGRDLKKVRKQIADAGLTGVSYVRGGFFPSIEKEKRRAAIEENRAIIREAGELGLPLIVLVCGADPGQSLETSRGQITDALGILASEAAEAGVVLGIEPLHPMYADTRSAVNTLGQANRIAEAVGHSAIQVVVDVYHLWWDENLPGDILRAGKTHRLAAFHVCDWKVPTEDFLLDRGLMGEGCIPIREIRGQVESAGFDGFIEVEIFSRRYWEMDQHQFLRMVVTAYRSVV